MPLYRILRALALVFVYIREAAAHLHIAAHDTASTVNQKAKTAAVKAVGRAELKADDRVGNAFELAERARERAEELADLADEQTRINAAKLDRILSLEV